MWKKRGELKLAKSMDMREMPDRQPKKNGLLREVGEWSLVIIGLGCAGVSLIAGPLCRALFHAAGEHYFGDSDSGSSGPSRSDRGYGDSVWTGSSGSGKKPGSWSSGRHRQR